MMYQDMGEILKDRQVGEWKLEHFQIKPGDLYAFKNGIDPGNYVRLRHNGRIMMSDTDMEHRTNMDFCVQANGDVLIGGLGIGLIILAIQDNPEVRSITVVEKSQEVIDMVATQLPLNEKVKIIQADVFFWKPQRGAQYDTIYMDIWPWLDDRTYQEEMLPLKRKFAHYLKPKTVSPNRFNRCWAERQAKTGSALR